jgi:ribonuclease R
LDNSTILQKIERQPKRTAGYKQLVRELGIRGNERRELAQRLRAMVRKGELLELERDRFTLPEAAAGKNLVAGRLTMHRDGFGFVQPEDEALRQKIDGDIFIPPHAMANAMHGDRVLVEMASRDGGGRGDGRSPGFRGRPDNGRPGGGRFGGRPGAGERVEGRVIRILSREHATVVGIFHYGNRHNIVVPMDDKITHEIVIPRGMEYPEPAPESAQDGQQPAHKPAKAAVHRVLGGEARRTKTYDDLEGVIVDVEITDWPTATQNPRGRVVEILGREDDFGVDVEIIIRKYHLPHRFPPDVIAEAQDIPNVIPAGELKLRRDFRQLPIVTIDGETARDFDDAVTARRLPNGHFELQVHIADVAHYVEPETPLDSEAKLRGTSVYFPDRAVPMLPVELSTDICSLRPKLDRLVMSCIMEIDRQGEVLSYELMQGVIRSAERMTYTDVSLILEGDAKLRQRYAPLVPTFELMGELAQILNRKRVRRGSIDFDLPEPVIEFDEQGLMKGVTRSERNDAHRLIEEFMLAANESVASYLEQQGVPAIYRIHEKPDPKKVFDFETIAARFGYSLGVGALPIQRVQLKADKRARHGSGKNAREIEIPEEVHITPRMYQKLTQKIAGKPEERILAFLMLRSLKQARYSEKNEGHFALAAPTYTHFTSPIRRYPDLLVHRILKAVLEEAGEGRGTPAHSEAPSPWSKRDRSQDAKRPKPGDSARHGAESSASHRKSIANRQIQAPYTEEELHYLAEISSQSERRADDAERELMEWKKIKFMQDRIGDDFDALIVSVTKFGLFVELEDMFIEGLVPLDSLTGDRFTYRENTREIIGERTRKKYSLGDRVKVILDRIDRVQRKLQFALVEEERVKPQRARR